MARAERRPLEQAEDDAAEADDGERRPIQSMREVRDGSRLSPMNRSDSASDDDRERRR